jgi:hypothetical protein
VALFAALLWPVTLLAMFPLAILLLGLNLPVYRFFHRERGFLFTLAVIPWHWLYYTYSGLCIFLGIWAYLRSGRQTTARGLQFEAVREPGPRVAA